MKAIFYDRYGPPEVLQLKDVEKPAPNDDQMLVRVHAVSLNPAEAHIRKGMLLARLMGGQPLRPKPQIIGADFAGRVEAAGRNITHYRPGDEVFGRRSPGGFAEYLVVSQKPVALKPANATFEEAAGVPVAGLTALQSLRDDARVQPGHKVLVNGASGGVGTFTVQIAKAMGAEVTGVSSPHNLDLVRSLGADRVLDYTREDFTRSRQQYDAIIDNVGNHTVGGLARALRPNGVCVIVGFTSVPLLLQQQVLGRLATRLSQKRIGSMLARTTHDDLVVLKDMIEAGQVRTVIGRCYPMTSVPEAYRYAETRHTRGKVIVTLPDS
jgi:NADPH:quinone reductase-like Zn-dependent oxidoreductase